VHALEPEAERLRVLGQTAVFVGIDGVAVGVLGVADPLKPEAWEVVQQLRAGGLQVVLLSGDHAASVQAVAGQLGVDELAAGVLPADKADRVRALRAAGRVVAMVGIAMGGGTDVARQTAGVTLVSGDLRGVVRALRLGEATMRNVRQNLGLAFGYNALGVPLAAGLLYPLTGMLLMPAFAAAAMSLSSVSVIANALRLRSTAL
jgi:Cu+-exporting ATPase